MPQSREDITGHRFGALVAESYAGSNRWQCSMWVCRCDCGGRSTTRRSSLLSGDTTSCGCKQRAAASVTAKSRATHGQSRSRLYFVWMAMVQRCTNTDAHDYASYGGRGITVCNEWLSFESFRDDMSPRPAGMWLERSDNDGPYNKTNCVWATPKQQAANRRLRPSEVAAQARRQLTTETES